MEAVANVVAAEGEGEGAIMQQEEEIEDVTTPLSIQFQNTLSGTTSQPAKKRENPKAPMPVADVSVDEAVGEAGDVTTRQLEEVEVTMTKKVRVQIIIKTKLVVKKATKQRKTSLVANTTRATSRRIQTASKLESRKRMWGE